MTQDGLRIPKVTYFYPKVHKFTPKYTKRPIRNEIVKNVSLYSYLKILRQ